MRGGARVAAGLAAAVMLLVAACLRRPSPLADPPSLEVAFAGCSALLAGPVCEIAGTRTLRLWVKAPGASLRVAVDGATRSSSGAPVRDGVLVTVEVAEGAQTLTLDAARDGAEAHFRLPIAGRQASPALAEARALRAAGKPAEAEARLRPLLDAPTAFERRQSLRDLARVERDLGRNEAAVAHFRQAIPLDQAAGRLSDEVDDQLALAYALVYDLRRLDEARALFPRLAARLPAYPEGAARAPYFEGLGAYEAGDLRAALRLFRASAEASERIGLVDQRVDALALWSDTLAILGRYPEAAARIGEGRAALPAGASACQRARLAGNAGWTSTRALGDPGQAGAALDPLPFLQEAIALYRGACADRARLSNALTNLALAEIERGRPEEARRALAQARAEDPQVGARVQAYWAMIEGRAALAEGRFEEARRLHEALAEGGARALFPEVQLEAALGRAQALEGLGREEAARLAYEEAERLLTAWSRLVPFGEGRETFLGRYQRSAALRVDFLLRTRPPGEAALVARRARARALRALAWMDRPGELPPERRTAWERSLVGYRKARAALDERAESDQWLPGDRQVAALVERGAEQAALSAALEQALAELGAAPSAHDDEEGRAGSLPAPAEGELILVYHPVREGWAGFALSAEGASAHRLGAIDPAASPERLAALLLAPFREALHGARRLRLAAPGALERVDFHALPWEGRPLAQSLPVSYGLDLPEHSAARPSAPAPARALIVADPLDDLPAARHEAALVAEALSAKGWQVERIEGDQATHAALLAGLSAPGLALFHYAGHALFEGRDGWESGLPLAAGGWLTVGDVLALPHAPAQVVLSGCDTARAAETVGGAGLGLGQAFALAGAGAVVASSRPVQDALAQRTMAALYGGPGVEVDLAAALGRAQQRVAGEPGADGSGFRVLVR